MAKTRPQILLTLSVMFLFLVADSYFGTARMTGGRTLIDDVKTNAEVQELGRYSVEEYNRKGVDGGERLMFTKVVEAEEQVVAGIKYYLKIAAVYKTTGVPKSFDAVVVVKPWVHSKELLNFAPSQPTK